MKAQSNLGNGMIWAVFIISYIAKNEEFVMVASILLI